MDVKNANIDRYVERFFYPILRQIPRHMWNYRQVRKELVFKLGDGDAIIDFGSAENPEGLEGFGYQTIILNEAGNILKNEHLWYSTILPMSVDYEDCEIFIGGTPRGKNLFHKLSLRAAESRSWQLFNLSSFDNPHLSQEQLAELVDSIPERFKDQELYGKFIDDGGTVFRGVNLCIRGDLEPASRYKNYKAGIDLARKSDFTAIVILDENNHLCAFHRMRNIDWTVQKMQIKQIVGEYEARALVDSTGIGDPVISDLQDMGLDVEGYQFTAKSKTQLIDNLTLGIEKQEVTFPAIPELINELESYEYDQGSTNIKYGTQSEHDDCVTALALAYWGIHKKPYVYTYHFASKDRRGRGKSIFELEKEYQQEEERRKALGGS